MPGLQCNICAHACRLTDGQIGQCQVRGNIDGHISHLGGKRLAVLHREPIERKPFFHFIPGGYTLSAGMVGCNMRCQFCINASLSQFDTDRPVSTWGREVPPELLIRTAIQSQCQSICFTYTEPALYLEYILEVVAAATDKQMPIVLVTNGFFTPATCDALTGKVAALNIDLKAFRESYYQTVCGGRLQPVLDTITHFALAGTHIEISTPIISELNDSPEELSALAGFIARLNPAIPWHLIRVIPAYQRTNTVKTTDAALQRAVAAGQAAGLHWIYIDGVAV
jgi:pyruvate formate lyase activating enzyme